MIRGIKICGVSDPKTLNYILNHPHPPKFIGFITNYEKSKRFVQYEKLRALINVDKKKVNFTSVLVDPNNDILEKIKDINFDYYQLYNVNPKRTREIKSKYKIEINMNFEKVINLCAKNKNRHSSWINKQILYSQKEKPQRSYLLGQWKSFKRIFICR